MLRRVFLFLSLLVMACASERGDTAAGASGRLVVERTAPQRTTLLDLPAFARVCERDSTLAIAAVSPQWSAAIVVRTAWPIEAGTDYPIGPVLGGTGSAAIAARALGDSLRTALVARSGAVSLQPGTPLNGHFEATVPGDSGPATALRGQFEALPVRTGDCP